MALASNIHAEVIGGDGVQFLRSRNIPDRPATTKTESQLRAVKRRDMMRSSCWKGTKKALPVRVAMLHFRWPSEGFLLTDDELPFKAE